MLRKAEMPLSVHQNGPWGRAPLSSSTHVLVRVEAECQLGRRALHPEKTLSCRRGIQTVLSSQVDLSMEVICDHPPLYFLRWGLLLIQELTNWATMADQ